ncbi:glycosyltransferase [uncultured Aquabacterium sp.]|uniref:glycosyltransferase n=1 Tax=uncultured Aquabacterium sp. TaxID=158753 RepID=UPI0025D8F69E|nr:glycosyltransferase [uncultured Aquabacterium sp.]
MSNTSDLRVALIDPSLFTGPYDAALTAGLQSCGVRPHWLTRPTRRGDRQEIPVEFTSAVFYKHVDDARAFPKAARTAVKGLAHLVGLARSLRCLIRSRPDVVHVQWVVLPPVDLIALWLIKRFRPVVLTVHDTVPFNGERISLLQNIGFHAPIRLADEVIVHTRSGRDTLLRHGIPASKINVVPHGPLPLHAKPDPLRPAKDPQRYTFVLFGELKPYKGVDLLVEAVGSLPADVREQARVIIAGRERMDMNPIYQRVKELGVEHLIDIRPFRQSEDEMANLFVDCDCFVFPYRQIDASGVYFLTKSFNKWMIASRVGIFAEDMEQGAQGVLVEPEDVDALKNALHNAITKRHTPGPVSSTGTWSGIGEMTRKVYEKAIRQRAERATALSS